MVEHEHVGLFDELGAGHSLGAEKYVGGDRRWCDPGHEERLQFEVAGKLLVKSSLGAPSVDQSVSQCPPGRCSASVAGPEEEFGTATKVPAGHDVRVCVVVDELVVLVGSHHPVEVTVAIGVGPNAAGPVAGGVDEQLTASSREEVGVARPGSEVRCCPGHVCHDVLFLRASADRDELVVLSPNQVWRDVTPVASRLPRKASATQALVFRCGACCGETADAVLEHGSGCRGPDGCQNW